MNDVGEEDQLFVSFGFLILIDLINHKLLFANLGRVSAKVHASIGC